MAGNITAATNANGYVDRFIDSSGNAIYIEPQTYHAAVEAANAAAASANAGAKSANSAAKVASDNASEAAKIATNFNAAEAARVANDIKRREATDAANAAATAASKAAQSATSAANAANATTKYAKPYFMQQYEPARSQRVDGMLWIPTNETNRMVGTLKRWDAGKTGNAIYPSNTTICGDTSVIDIEGEWTTFSLPRIA